MKRHFSSIGWLGLLLQAAAWGAVLPGDGVVTGGSTFRSSSGQFVVGRMAGSGATGGAVAPATNAPAWVDLEPRALVLTCERVKKAFLWDLSLYDQWVGRIYVVINPALANDQPPVIGVQRFVEGWQYRIEVPPRIQPTKLVRGLVQVLLLEFSNRRAGIRSAEMPLWLSEGLALRLVRASFVDLVVPQPNETVNRVDLRSMVRQTNRHDPLAEARDRLQTHAAMSLFRLGEMTSETLPAETWRTFQASAQLLVSQLLELPQGRQLLTGMISQLPAYLNWQSAFLLAYQRVFHSMLDAEKWWSVVLMHFTGLDPLNAWSPEAALTKLDNILRPPLLVNVSRSELSVRRQLPLQEVIREWDYLRQRGVVKDVTAQLTLVRAKMPPELAALADNYRLVLERYLGQRDRTGISRLLGGPSAATTARLVREVIQDLERLDEQRRTVRVAAASH